MYTEKEVEIDLDKKIKIPRDYIVKEFNSKKLILFYELPNWVIFSNGEYNIFKHLTNCKVEDVQKKVSVDLLSHVLIKLYSRKIINDDKKKQISNISLPLHVYLTNKCNLRCKHCYMNSGFALNNELNLSEWKKVILNFIEYGGKEISISGGEPFLVDYLSELLEFIKNSNRSIYVKLLTNGTYLKKMSNSFYNNYIDEVQLSIDGPNAELHDFVRGKGHFNIIMNNLKHLIRYSGLLTISMSVLDNVIDDFKSNFRNFYNEIMQILPNAKFGIATDLMDGRSYKKLDYEVAGINLKKIENIFNNTIKKLNMEGQEEKKYERNEKITSCGFGGTIAITANGLLYPCGVIYKSSIGNHKECSFGEIIKIYENILKRYSVDNIPECLSCNLKYVCGGTCRIENHKKFNNFKTPFCNELAKKDILYSLFKDDKEFENDILNEGG